MTLYQFICLTEYIYLSIVQKHKHRLSEKRSILRMIVEAFHLHLIMISIELATESIKAILFQYITINIKTNISLKHSGT